MTPTRLKTSYEAENPIDTGVQACGRPKGTLPICTLPSRATDGRAPAVVPFSDS